MPTKLLFVIVLFHLGLGSQWLYAQWDETGIAAHYANDMHGKKIRSGDKYDKFAFTAAHHDLPLGSVVRVTRLDNSKSVKVKVNDCCNVYKNRIIVLSHAAAEKIDLIRDGSAQVKVELLSLGEGERCQSKDYAAKGGTAVPASYSGGKTSQARTPAATPAPVSKTSAAAQPGVYDATILTPIQSGYGVQIGAYAQRSNAEARVAELRKRGFKSVLVRYDGDTAKVPWRVIIGPFEKRENAEAYAKDLLAKYKIKGLAVSLAPSQR